MSLNRQLNSNWIINYMLQNDHKLRNLFIDAIEVIASKKDRILIYLLLVNISILCCNSSKDVSKYYYPCSKNCQYNFQGYLEGRDMYKRILNINKCECNDGLCESVVNEKFVDAANGKTTTKIYKYFITKDIIKRVDVDMRYNDRYEIILKAPILVGSKWQYYENNAVSSSNSNNEKRLNNPECEIIKIYYEKALGTFSRCIIVKCDNNDYTFCKNKGLLYTVIDKKIYESIGDIYYEVGY